MRDRLYALLEDGAHTAPELAGWLREDTVTVVRALKAMAAEGVVVRLTAGDRVTWQLTGAVLPAPRSAKRRRASARQPHDRPTSQVVSADAPSWWVGLDRARFAATAAKEFDRRMRGSKAAQRVKTTDGGSFEA